MANLDDERRLKSLGLQDADPSSRQRNFVNLLESPEKDKLRLLESALEFEKHPPIIKFLEEQIKNLRTGSKHKQTKSIRKRIQLAFQNDDPKVQARAVQYILKAQLIEAYDLIKHIAQLRNQDWLTINAIQLAAIQPSRFREDLMEWMKNPQPEIRKQAFLSLIKHDVISSQAYAACLILDESQDVRDFVLMTIKEMRPQARSAMLSRMSKSDHDTYIKSFNFISKNLNTSDRSKIISEDSIPAKHILDQDFSIVDHFQRLLENTKDNFQLASALLALGGISEDSEKIRKILLNYLAHEDHRVRANALEGFIELCTVEDVRKLVQCSYDDNNRVVANAIIGLWKLGGQEQHIEAGITRLLNRGDIASFKSACHALGLIHDDAFAESLRIHLSREDEGFSDTELYQEGVKLLHRLGRHSISYAQALRRVQEFYLDDALSAEKEEEDAYTEKLMESDNLEVDKSKSNEMEDLISVLSGDGSKLNEVVQENNPSKRLSPFCDQCIDDSKSSKQTQETAYAINDWLSFGKRFHSKSEKCSTCGSVISTLWFCFPIPIIPLGSYKLIHSRSMRDEILAMRRTSISVKQIITNYVFLIPIILLIWILPNFKDEAVSPQAYLEMADKLYLEKKYSEAIEFYEKAAALNNNHAIYMLGFMNYKGQGRLLNQIAGFRFFKQCSGQKFPSCEYMLGKMYVEQQAGLTNVERGLDLLYRAEKLNYAPASYYLYVIYRDGFEKISKNIDMAMEHLSKSSKLNHPEALASMARHLLNGDGISKNELQAKQYIDAAARFEEPWAMKYLANQILLKNPGKHRLRRAFQMLDKVSKVENTGESEFIKGKYMLEFLNQADEGWTLIDTAREKGWDAAELYK
ncbi:MAG: hypothetical protein VX619_06745 [bacterium]|nr:hypothetical protein [bacterium]